MAKRSKHSPQARPIVKVLAREDGLHVLLYYAREQRQGTVVGDGVYSEFSKAFVHALVAAKAVGADLTITAQAIARYAIESDSFADEIAQTQISEEFEG